MALKTIIASILVFHYLLCQYYFTYHYFCVFMPNKRCSEMFTVLSIFFNFIKIKAHPHEQMRLFNFENIFKIYL